MAIYYEAVCVTSGFVAFFLSYCRAASVERTGVGKDWLESSRSNFFRLLLSWRRRVG
jgi:hypothetical protein